MNEIKKTSHEFTVSIKRGSADYDEYLRWFAKLPEREKEQARQAYLIFEQYHFSRISGSQAASDYAKMEGENMISRKRI